MPGYGILLAYALLLTVATALVVGFFTDAAGGVTTGVIAGIFLLAILSVAYLLASYPDRHAPPRAG